MVGLRNCGGGAWNCHLRLVSPGLEPGPCRLLTCPWAHGRLRTPGLPSRHWRWRTRLPSGLLPLCCPGFWARTPPGLFVGLSDPSLETACARLWPVGGAEEASMRAWRVRGGSARWSERQGTRMWSREGAWASREFGRWEDGGGCDPRAEVSTPGESTVPRTGVREPKPAENSRKGRYRELPSIQVTRFRDFVGFGRAGAPTKIKHDKA